MKQITLSQAFPIIQETLSAGGSIRYYPKGISMLPMLRQNIDSVVLVRPSGRLQEGDIPLFRRNDGHFVLHRIIKVRKNDYILCGDHQQNLEKNVHDDQIIGVVQGFYREDTYIPIDNPEYCTYVNKIIKNKKKLQYRFPLQRIKSLGKRLLHE